MGKQTTRTQITVRLQLFALIILLTLSLAALGPAMDVPTEFGGFAVPDQMSEMSSSNSARCSLLN
jgi:hypothetical protein